MQLNHKIVCAVLNYQRLDDRALTNLKNADLKNDVVTLTRFRSNLGIEIDSLAIVKKCNAIMVLISYQDDISLDHLRGRLLSTWDQCVEVSILNTIRDIRIFHGVDAINFLAECAVGLHSVTIGDSQVAGQINDALLSGIHTTDANELFRLLAEWIKGVVSECKLRTHIFEGNISLERIACGLVSQNIIQNKNILLIGYGKSGKLIAKILNQELSLPLYIVNRTPIIIKNEKLDVETAHYLPFDSSMIPANVGCIIVAVDSNDDTNKLINDLVSSIPSTENIYKIDLASQPLLDRKFGTFVDIKELSKIAESNTGIRRVEINKVRTVIQKKLNVIIDNINTSVGKLYIHRQKTHGLKLDKQKLDLVRQRALLISNVRNYLSEKEFIEVTTPYIVGISTDPPKIDKGGTINVDWINGTTAFLRQSNQMYKQILVASGLHKIYEIGPFWRKEENESYRHLQESLGLDIELSNPKNLEELYRLACTIIMMSNTEIVQTFKLSNSLSFPNIDSLPVLTYHEAIELLRKNGNPVTLGDDLGLVSEAKLGQLIKNEYDSDIFVIKDYPDTIKKFYTKDKPGGLTETFDVIVGGWELVSGAIRQTDGQKIQKSMSLSGINISDYEFYISIVDKAVQHGGFCIGIDRLIAKILNKEMVQDAVPFPRTYRRLIP